MPTLGKIIKEQNKLEKEQRIQDMKGICSECMKDSTNFKMMVDQSWVGYYKNGLRNHGFGTGDKGTHKRCIPCFLKLYCRIKLNEDQLKKVIVQKRVKKND